MIRAAVITVSDGVCAGTRVDTSGLAIVAALRAAHFDTAEPVVVPDERDIIAGKLRELDADVIFTTGGTGVAPRDVTPEATRDVIDREIPGFGELMRSEGRAKARMAALSRAIAGSRGTVLIVNLPGSPRGAVESLGAILDLVPHVHDLLNGRTSHFATGAAGPESKE